MRDLLFFDRMITPSIITIIYWLALAGVVVSALWTLLNGAVLSGLGILVFGALGARIYCELMIVLFKIHGNLQRIADRS